MKYYRSTNLKSFIIPLMRKFWLFCYYYQIHPNWRMSDNFLTSEQNSNLCQQKSAVWSEVDDGVFRAKIVHSVAVHLDHPVQGVPNELKRFMRSFAFYMNPLHWGIIFFSVLSFLRLHCTKS